MSSYYPRHDAIAYDDLPPPRPPPEMPPLPPYGARRSGDSWRSHAPSRREFSFRNHSPALQYPRSHDSYRPHEDDNIQTMTQRRNRHSDKKNINPNLRGRHGRGGRALRSATCNRPLLKQQHRETEAELEMLGVTEGAAKYLKAEDVDDSSEQEMDQSDSDREDGELLNHGFDGNEETETIEPPAKRRETSNGDKDAADLPKWSNPDPYFVLPPIDDTLNKRKDPVGIIRKYRRVAEERPTETNQVSANDDFISFEMDGGPLAEPNISPSEHDSDEGGVRIAGLPRGPRESRTRQTGGARMAQDVLAGAQSLNASGFHDLTTHRATPNAPEHMVLDIDSGGSIYTNKHEDLARFADDGDSSFGSRKRTHDDQIKGSSARVAPKRHLPGPGLLAEWQPLRGTNPIPWLVRSEIMTIQAGFRLHKEICDFFDFVRPQHFEEIIREELIERLRAVIKKDYPKCDVYCFGSFAAGLYLPNADMDVVIISDSYRNRGEKLLCQSHNKMRKFGDFITRSGIATPDSVDVIVGAKVPLIKFVDRDTSIRVDLSFENDTGLVAIDTFHAWKRRFPAMPVIVTIIKQFLMMRGMNEVQHGGLGGFSVTCLVTSLLQNMPRIQTGEILPEHHLGEVLIEFLDFYGSRFDIARTGIRMNPPEYFEKHAFNRGRSKNSAYKPSLSDRLAILDPNDSYHDISGGSRNVLLIFDQFAKAHYQILEAMKATNRPSLLDWMLGGNYESFLWQRNHLRKLFEERYTGNLARQRQPGIETTLSCSSAIIQEKSKSSNNFSEDPRSGQNPPDVPKRQIQREKRMQRADRLRRQYPDMSEIPQMIGKKLQKTLINKYKENRKAKTSSSTFATSGIGSHSAPKPSFSDIKTATTTCDVVTRLHNPDRHDCQLHQRPPLAAIQEFTAVNNPGSSCLPLEKALTLEMADGALASQDIAGKSPSEPIVID